MSVARGRIWICGTSTWLSTLRSATPAMPLILSFSRSAVARNSAYASFKHRLRNRGMWNVAREQLAREWFNQMYDVEARRREQAAADTAQFFFPGFETLPAIRLEA